MDCIIIGCLCEQNSHKTIMIAKHNEKYNDNRKKNSMA